MEYVKGLPYEHAALLKHWLRIGVVGPRLDLSKQNMAWLSGGYRKQQDFSKMFDTQMKALGMKPATVPKGMEGFQAALDAHRNANSS